MPCLLLITRQIVLMNDNVFKLNLIVLNKLTRLEQLLFQLISFIAKSNLIKDLAEPYKLDNKLRQNDFRKIPNAVF